MWSSRRQRSRKMHSRRIPRSSCSTPAARQLSINTQAVALADLETRLRDVFANRRDKTLFFMGDGHLRYGDVIAVVDAAKGAGVQRVGVVTERCDEAVREDRPLSTVYVYLYLLRSCRFFAVAAGFTALIFLRSALAGFFFSALTESRLRRSASIRSTTFGGSCTSGATISSPAILASMILRSPSVYSSL